MVNTFVPRLPNYCDSSLIDRTPYSFSIIDELKQHSHVKNWMNMTDFVELQKSDDCLIATTKTAYWVIGFINIDNNLDLPIWSNDDK